MTLGLKACVIGLGSMGRHHARIAGELPGVELIGVCDPDKSSLARAARAAKSRRGRKLGLYAEHRRMLDELRPDIVIVAVPTELHCSIACDAIERGAHVLVEKPIAPTIGEARTMIALAEKKGRKLMVGHSERCNPAVTELERRMRSKEVGRVHELHARRLGLAPPRVPDVGVILDLAIHDIDAMLFLTRSHVVRAYAESSLEDSASGILRFASGAVGVIDVSWCAPEKVRQLCVVAEGGTYVADYLTQRVHRRETKTTGSIGAPWEPLGALVDGRAPRLEPLRIEHEHFVACVRNDTTPFVTGAEALSALMVGLDMLETGQAGAPKVA